MRELSIYKLRYLTMTRFLKDLLGQKRLIKYYIYTYYIVIFNMVLKAFSFKSRGKYYSEIYRYGLRVSASQNDTPHKMTVRIKHVVA